MYPQSHSYTPFLRWKSAHLLMPLFVVLATTFAITSVGAPHLAFAEDMEPAAIVETAAGEANGTPAECGDTAESGDSDQSALVVTAPEQSAVVDDTPEQQVERASSSAETPATKDSDELADDSAADPVVDPATDSAVEPIDNPATDSTVDPSTDPTNSTTDEPTVTPGTEQSTTSGRDVTEEAPAEQKTDTKTTASEAEKNADDSAAAEAAGTKIAESIAAQLKPVVRKLAATTSATSTDPFVIVIDAGHGGFDSGAVGNGLQEHALNLSIAKHIQELLQGFANVVVYMTRTTNTSFTSVTKTDLLARVNFAVEHSADVFISVHTNSGPSSAHGIEVIAQNDSSYRYELHTESMGLANAVFNAERAIGLASHSGVYTRDYGSGSEGKYPDGSNADYLSLLRNCRKNNIPAILIENLFISNKIDANFLRSDANRLKIAQAIVNGIVKYYNLSKSLVSDANGLRYLNNDKTYAKNTFKNVNGKTYYFGDNTYAVKWAQTIGGKHYYFDGSCAMVTGWVTWNADKSRSYFGSDGASLSGWQTVEGKKYYFDSDNWDHGYRWAHTLDGKYYYFDADCHMWTGWLTWAADKSRSYFGSDGAALSGWQTVGGKRYYFDPKNSYHGLRWVQTLDGKMYYFDADCHMWTGWLTWNADKTRSYFDPDSASATYGAALPGWRNDGAKRCYIEPKTLHAVRWAQTIGGKYYYFDADCHMWTGWLTWAADKSRSYLGSDGAALSGWQTVGGKRYYFDPKNSYHGLRWVQTLDGKMYYFDADCHMWTGWLTWAADKSRSYFGSDGVAVTDWQTIGGKRYYFLPTTYRAVRWLQTIGDNKYYFDGSYAMQTGWITWNADKSRSYFNVNKNSTDYGAMLYGEQTIDGVPYDFGTSGKYYPQSIMGATQTTVTQMARYYIANYGTSAYPTNVYSSKGAKTINDFCQILYEEAKAEGVRAEVLYAQVMLETGYLQFGGDVLPKQCNFGGIGATGNGVPGYSFKDVRTGLRAQTQHLKAYASTAPLNNACVDPRFHLITRGSATTVYALAGKWAVGNPEYGKLLTNIMDDLLAV